MLFYGAYCRWTIVFFCSFNVLCFLILFLACWLETFNGWFSVELTGSDAVGQINKLKLCQTRFVLRLVAAFGGYSITILVFSRRWPTQPGHPSMGRCSVVRCRSPLSFVTNQTNSRDYVFSASEHFLRASTSSLTWIAQLMSLIFASTFASCRLPRVCLV